MKLFQVTAVVMALGGSGPDGTRAFIVAEMEIRPAADGRR